MSSRPGLLFLALAPLAAMLFLLSASLPRSPRTLQSAPVEKQDSSAGFSAVSKKAKDLIDHRETPGALEQAITLLSSDVSDAGPRLPILIELAEAHCILVDRYDLRKASDQALHRSHREAGKAIAAQAVQLDPGSGAAHYWYGSLLLFCSDGEQSYPVLKQALKELETADRLSPDTDDGGPARMLGRIYQQTPGWPLLGSDAKAIGYLERALKTAPANLKNRLWLGLSYEAVGRTKQAREQFEFVVASNGHPNREREEQALRTEALDHLKKLDSR